MRGRPSGTVDTRLPWSAQPVYQSTTTAAARGRAASTRRTSVDVVIGRGGQMILTAVARRSAGSL